MRNGYFVLVLGNFNLVSGEKSEEHIANQRVHFIGFSISEGENISLVQQICFNGAKLFKKKKYLNTVSEISNLNLTSYCELIIGANTFINFSNIILCIKQF